MCLTAPPARLIALTIPLAPERLRPVEASGEMLLRDSGADHLIVRTAWLYGPRGKNFVEAILRQAEAGRGLRVVNDQKGSPTFTRDLSGAIRDLLEAGPGDFPRHQRGRLHLV